MFRKEERGSVTLEAVISFTVFLFLFVTIISILNFCRVQAKMSMVVNGIAKEMSQYSYMYSISGLEAMDKDINTQADAKANEMNSLISTFDDLTSTIKGVITVEQDINATDDPKAIATIVYEEAQSAVGGMKQVEDVSAVLISQIEQIGSDPVSFMKGIALILGQTVEDRVKSYLAETLSKQMAKKYLSDINGDYDKELKHLGVINGFDGLNFQYSQMFHSSAPDDIIISVVYEVELIQLLDLNFKATMVSTAHTRAWLNGDIDPKTNKPKDEVKEEATKEPGWSVWEMGNFERAKYIKTQEINNSLPDALESFTSGIHAYDPNSNQLISIHTLDTFAKSYVTDQSIEKKMNEYIDKLIESGEKTNSVSVLEGTSGSETNKTYDISEKDKSYKIVLVVPAEADVATLNEIRKKVLDGHPGVTLDIVDGYGKSTNDVKENE